jgi:adenylosuccinate synthase
MATPFVDVLVGGQYGSEGKGQIAAHLAPEYDLLVRVGGPNAGHTVYSEPDPHTFHHLPSGTTSSSAALLLGAGAVISVPKLQEEIERYLLNPSRLNIDPNVMIIEENDRRFEEDTLRGEIGSTAQGVGRATARKILRTAAEPRVRLAREIRELRPFIRSGLSILATTYERGQRVFLEGTQGSALSLHHGCYPYVTSRDTTIAGCLAEAGIAPAHVRRTILVCRTYPIRVENPSNGTSGPLANEIDLRTISERSGIPLTELTDREKTTTTNRKRRIGEFDWDLVRHSVQLNAPTDFALTFVDYLSIDNRKASSLQECTPEARRLVDRIERELDCPVSLLSVRFHTQGIIDRRSWRSE